MVNGLRWYLAHRRTRDTTPCVGQRWAQRDGYTVFVDAVFDNGRIGVTTKPPDYDPVMYASWGEEPDEFRSRTRRGRYVLVSS